MAYSETKEISCNKKGSVPYGFEIWIEQNIAAIAEWDNKKSKENKNRHRGWDALLSEKETNSSAGKNKEPIDDTCPDETYEVGPLLQTAWGQDEGYNNDAPNHNCAGTANGRALTGCVATAIAQVMRYHEHPASYNWDIMPDGGIEAWDQPSGTEEIAELMYDVGDAVSMNWGCPASGGSGAYTSDGEAALESNFNYSSSVDYKVTIETK